MDDFMKGALLGSILTGFVGCMFDIVRDSGTPSITQCAKRYNVYECELVAVPKGSNWLLPPPAGDE